LARNVGDKPTSWNNPAKRDFRLRPRSRRELPSSVLLRSEWRQFLTETSGRDRQVSPKRRDRTDGLRRDVGMWPTGCIVTSVRDYHYFRTQPRRMQFSSQESLTTSWLKTNVTTMRHSFVVTVRVLHPVPLTLDVTTHDASCTLSAAIMYMIL